MKAKITFSALVVLVIAFSAVIIFHIYSGDARHVYRLHEQQIQTAAKSSTEQMGTWLWQPGRSFVFDIVYCNLFSIGKLELRVVKEMRQEGIPGYQLQAVVHPAAWINNRYQTAIQLTSIVRKDTKVSLMYQEDIQTPDEQRIKTIRFDPAAHRAIRNDIAFKIPDQTYDPLSVLFAFLDEGSYTRSITKALISKEEIYEFHADYVRSSNEIVELRGYVFREDRSSKHGATFTIFLTEKEPVTPLSIKIVTAAGPVYLRLMYFN